MCMLLKYKNFSGLRDYVSIGLDQSNLASNTSVLWALATLKVRGS